MSSFDPRLRGLYVITDTRLCAERGLIDSVAAALRGGARLVQYRDKTDERERRLDETRQLAHLCERHGAQLIVNDDIELAREAGAHGVHLGRDDANPELARRLLPRRAIVGISCYDDFERAQAAMRTGASYVAFGSIFPSRIKPHAVRAPLSLLTRAAGELQVPACAIGGIDRTNIDAVIRAGATMAAVVSAVFEADDIASAAHELSAAFETQER